MSRNDLDLVYSKYKSSINMSYSELLRWSENPCSRKASLSRGPILRNLRLIGKRKNEWTKRDISDAKRTISFIARHKGQPAGKPVSKDCPYSRRFVALANWGYWSK